MPHDVVKAGRVIGAGLSAKHAANLAANAGGTVRKLGKNPAKRAKPVLRYWIVKQGRSRARVRAVDHAAAKTRAAAIGFKDPDSIMIDDTPPTKANPRAKKEQRPFYWVVKVPPNGNHYHGQFMSTHYTRAQVEKLAQEKADKYGAQAAITEFHS